MSPRLRSSEVFERAREAGRRLYECRLCPRGCGADRTSGERGYCGAGPVPEVAAILPHLGEEPPLCGSGGAGTIFFSRCNLRCVYCQNHQISQGSIGSEMSPESLAEKILELQSMGCACVEPVSPSHHLPGLLDALALAVDRGLDLPVVYNTNGYESLETLELLDGVVDVYLPDLKYADGEMAGRYSDCADYVERAREAILEMHRQVGDLVLDAEGRAVRGLIIRHLVFPGGLSGVRETFAWIRDNLSLSVTVSLMAQYSPMHRSREFPPLDRRLTGEDYDRAVDIVWEMGFENAFVQDVGSQDVGVPDFGEGDPFRWF